MTIFRVLMGIVLAVALASCGVKESIAGSEQGVTIFHQNLDAQDYRAIWQSTSTEFRKVSKREDFDRLLEAITRKLGKVKSTEQVTWHANSGTGGSTVQLVYQTQFERGDAQETFIFLRDGDRLRLQGYNIASQAMMLN